MKKLYRNFIVGLIIIVLFVSPLLTFPVLADTVVEISTASQLNSIRDHLDYNYRLTADIDMGSFGNWTPLGSTAAPFTGSLDGGGFSIKNLVIANTQDSNQGLFGVIGGTGTVSNLQIKAATVTAADSAGILSGVNQGAISRVLAQGIIGGANVVGGLVGTNSGTISNSYAMATVSGRNKNGGLVGTNNGTLTNTYAASSVSGAVTNNYIQFDGTDDYISIPHNPAYVADSFTLEAWFQWTPAKPDDTSFITGKGLENFEIHTGGGSGNYGIRFIPVNRQDDVLGQTADAYNDVHNVLQPGWNHVAANWDYANQQVRVFLNGIPQHIWQSGVDAGTVATVPLAHPEINPLADNTKKFFIGARNDQINEQPFFFFKGNIADVRFWNRVRTASEIANDKYKQLTGNETGLIGYWKLNEASGTTVVDSSSVGNNGVLLGGATRVQEAGINGGLVGENTGTVNTSYYDSTVSNLSDTGKGTPLSTALMKQQLSFDGWDFSTVWKILEDRTYPSLFTIDVAINQASGQADPASTGPINFTAVFNETIDPASFTAEDVTLSGSAGAASVVISEVAPNDGTTFNLAVSGMTADGTVIASIPAGKVQDLANNFNNASTSTDNTVTYDAVPTVIISSTASNPTRTSPIPVTITFSEDVTGFEAGDITVGNGSAGNFSGSGQTYSADITPAADGQVHVDISAGVAVDSASQGNTVGEQFTIVYDHTSPTVTVSQTTGQADPTNASPIHFTAVFNEAIASSSFTAEDVTLGGSAGATHVDISEAAPNDGTTFDIAVSGMTADGTVTVSIPADKVQDLAGNLNSASTGEDHTVTYDTTAPSVTVTQATGQADPTKTGPIHFTAVFSEAIASSSFTAEDVTLGGSAGATSAVISEAAPNNGTTFNIAVSGMTVDGTVTASIPAGKVQDLAGNLNSASTGEDHTVTYDTTVPSVIISSTVSNPTRTSPIPVTITFSENVTGFVVSDITVSNGSAGNFSGSGKIYSADITPTTDGQVSIDVPAGVAVDSASLKNTAGERFTVAFDSSGPVVTINQASGQADPTETGPIHFTAVFNEAIDPASFVAEDITVSGSTGAANVVISEVAPNNGTTYNIAVSGMTDNGEITVFLDENKVTDLLGNENSASSSSDNTVTFHFPVEQTIVTLNVAEQTVAFKQIWRLTATVASDNLTPVGTVTFRDGETLLGTSELVNGIATLDVPALPGGAHRITAEYSGGENHYGSVSGEVPLTARYFRFFPAFYHQ